MKISYEYKCINSDSALIAATAALEQASEIGVSVAVGVVDRGGNLIAFLRSNAGPYLSIDIAIDKAYTSASFGVATSAWKEFLPKDSILRESILNRDRFVGFGGGLPIVNNGECIGAIGVSGASEEQDEVCAQAGLDSIIN